MGLDAFVYYQCPFRQNADTRYVLRVHQAVGFARLMRQHGTREMTRRLSGPFGQINMPVTWDEVEWSERAMYDLSYACSNCPARIGDGVPGCHARVDYPLDGHATLLLCAVFAFLGEHDTTGFIVGGPDCRGDGMVRVLEQLGEQVDSLALAPYVLFGGGRRVEITIYGFLERLFFEKFHPPHRAHQIGSLWGVFDAAILERARQQCPGPNSRRDFLALSASVSQLNAYIEFAMKCASRGLGIIQDG